MNHRAKSYKQCSDSRSIQGSCEPCKQLNARKRLLIRHVSVPSPPSSLSRLDDSKHNFDGQTQPDTCVFDLCEPQSWKISTTKRKASTERLWALKILLRTTADRWPIATAQKVKTLKMHQHDELKSQRVERDLIRRSRHCITRNPSRNLLLLRGNNISIMPVNEIFGSPSKGSTHLS